MERRSSDPSHTNNKNSNSKIVSDKESVSIISEQNKGEEKY
jgi:hypothetical protein